MKASILLLGAFTIPLNGAAAPHAAPVTSVSELAAPRIIMIHGGALDSVRYLTDWHENLEFMLSVNEVSGKVADLNLADRRYVDLALFWYGPTWDRFAKDTTLLKTLDPTGKEVGHGRLYLPKGELPAVLLYPGASVYRVVNEKGIRILEKYRVPVAP